MEAAGLVVDQVVRGMAVLGRMAFGGVRLQLRPLLPELRRGEGRAVGAPRAVSPVGRARPSQVVRHRGIRGCPARGDAARRVRGMDCEDGVGKLARRRESSGVAGPDLQPGDAVRPFDSSFKRAGDWSRDMGIPCTARSRGRQARHTVAPPPEWRGRCQPRCLPR